MSGRKRRGQEWEREMMERETGVGEIERDRDWTKREREREIEDTGCGIQVWNKERDMELFYYLPCYLSLLKML